MFDGPVGKPLFRSVQVVAASAVLAAVCHATHRSWAVSLTAGGLLLLFGAVVVAYCVHLDRRPEALEALERRGGRPEG